jgi:hypothetical protein
MQRALRAAAAAAPAPSPPASLLARALSAHAGMPTNVSVAVPRAGPLGLPPGSPVWKRKPGAPTQVLYERTPKEMLKNVQYLAATPHHAPARPTSLHRLLERVATRGDLDLALRGLNTLKNSRVELNKGTTARLLAEAAVRAGAPEVAVETFAAWKATGLKPNKGALVTLCKAVQAPAHKELLNGAVNVMWAAGPGFDGTPKEVVRCARARASSCVGQCVWLVLAAACRRARTRRCVGAPGVSPGVPAARVGCTPLTTRPDDRASACVRLLAGAGGPRHDGVRPRGRPGDRGAHVH